MRDWHFILNILTFVSVTVQNFYLKVLIIYETYYFQFNNSEYLRKSFEHICMKSDYELFICHVDCGHAQKLLVNFLYCLYSEPLKLCHWRWCKKHHMEQKYRTLEFATSKYKNFKSLRVTSPSHFLGITFHWSSVKLKMNTLNPILRTMQKWILFFDCFRIENEN